MTTNSRVTALISLSLISLSACAHRVKGPHLLEEPSPTANAWTSVALTLAGSEVNKDKRDDCLEEARQAGVQLSSNAAVKGTLYFLDHDDYLEAEHLQGKRYKFSAMGSSGECRLALAKLTSLDTLVKTSKVEPPDCQNLGTVEGGDNGWMIPGNYDAAVAEAQFKVRALGGNYFAMDVVRQEGPNVRVNGHAFNCSK